MCIHAFAYVRATFTYLIRCAFARYRVLCVLAFAYAPDRAEASAQLQEQGAAAGLLASKSALFDAALGHTLAWCAGL